MSSIQTLNQIQSLDINNKLVAQTKNTITVKEHDTLQELTKDILSSVQLNESIDLTEHERSTTYTMLSPVDNLYRSNIPLLENNVEDDNNPINIVESCDIDDESYSSSIYSFDEPFNLIYNAMHSSNLSTMVFNKESINIADNTLNTSVNLNKNRLDTFIDPFNKPYEMQEIDQNPIISSKSVLTSASKSDSDNVMLSDHIEKNDSFVKNKTMDATQKQSLASFFSESDQNVFDIGKYQENFNILKDTKKLDENFISAIENASFTINGNKISNTSVVNVLREFKKIIPNLESRQLLSSYICSDTFKKPFDDLSVQYPDLYKFTKVNPVIEYDIQELNDGKFRLNASNIAELKLTDKEYYQKYKSIGVKESFLLSKDETPELCYSSFVR